VGNAIATSEELMNEDNELKRAFGCLASRMSRVKEGQSRTIEWLMKQEQKRKKRNDERTNRRNK
jgi:hypothetical protein